MHPVSPCVFISYSSKDLRLAEEVERKLAGAKIKVLRDKSLIEVGENFKVKISKGLEQATHLVLIATPASLESPWVYYELGQAAALHCPILPLLSHPSLKLPSFLTDLHSAKTIDELVTQLTRYSISAQTAHTIAITPHDLKSKVVPVALVPYVRMVEFLRCAPPSWYEGNIAIDGAIEMFTFPDHANRYGGIVENQLTTVNTEEEWSDIANNEIPPQRLDILGTTLQDWIGARRAKPNRIRYLVEPPKQMILDNNEFQMKIGNSDYFTMRTITKLSQSSHSLPNGGPIAAVFDSWWSTPGSRFPPNCVPYHLSAQGVLFNTDPETHCRYLILTLPSSQRDPLVSGWNATFAEQMWAPSPRSQYKPWWQPYVKDLNIADPSTRTGDKNLFDTLMRGAYEELGLHTSDINSDPRLIMACFEQDMHFLGFVFVLETQFTLSQFKALCSGSPDKEIGVIAAYPIDGQSTDGTRLNGARQFANILKDEHFDGGPYLLSGPGPSIKEKWHLSSRLRIYAAARHLLGNRFSEYAKPVPMLAYSKTTFRRE